MPNAQYPVPDAVDVPVDAWVWDPCVPGHCRVSTLDGTIIDGEWRTFDVGGVSVHAFAPTQPLAPSVRHVVRRFDEPVDALVATYGEDGVDEHATSSFAFTTGTVAASDAAVASVAMTAADVGPPGTESTSSCDEHEGWDVGIAVSVEHDGRLVVVVRGAADADGGVDDALPASMLDGFVGAWAYLGTSLCADNWLDAAPGVTEVFRFGAVGVDGSFSGWTALAITVPDPPDAGFAVVDAGVEPSGDAGDDDDDDDDDDGGARPADPPACAHVETGGGAPTWPALLLLGALRRRRR